jgi:hypothetical protein
MVRLASTSMERTNDLGEYRLFGLAPGRYYISASPESPSSTATDAADSAVEFGPTYYPAAPTVRAAQPVSLEPGEELQGVHITSIPTQLSRVRGSVADSESAPVQNAGVHMSFPGLHGDLTTTHTRADGTFEFSAVAPDTYVLSATADRRDGPIRVQSRVLVSGPEVVVGLQARGLGTIRGRLVVDGHTPLQLGQVRIAAVPADSEDITVSPSPSGRVDDNGTFEFRAPQGLSWILPFGLQRSWVVKSVQQHGRDVIAGVDVVGGETADITVTITDSSNRVSGRVNDTGGHAVKDYVAVIFPANEASIRMPIRLMNTAVSDASGVFRFDALPDGDYYVIAFDHFSLSDDYSPEFYRTATPLATAAKLTNGQVVDLVLRLRSWQRP